MLSRSRPSGMLLWARILRQCLVLWPALLGLGAPLNSKTNSVKFWLHELKAMTWNVRSLWANESFRIFRCINSLAGQLDLLILAETRECEESRSAIPIFISSQWEVFSSGIDAYSGGIAIWVRKTFLQQYFPDVAQRIWHVLIPGRLGILRLESDAGSLSFVAVYLHPSDAHQQKFAIRQLAGLNISDSTCFLAGDLNFVVKNEDRINKIKHCPSGTNDACVAALRQQTEQDLGISEVAQDSFTFTNKTVSSKIDRVYTNIHCAAQVIHRIFANILEKQIGISDHSPVVLGILSRQGNTKATPSWIVKHPCFLEEFRMRWGWHLERFKDCSPEPSPFEILDQFKSCAVQTSRWTKRKLRESAASSLEERLAVTTCFVHFVLAVLEGQFQAASQVATRYSRLPRQGVNLQFASSSCFTNILDHLCELQHLLLQKDMETLMSNAGNMTELEFLHRKNMQKQYYFKFLETALGFNLWKQSGRYNGLDPNPWLCAEFPIILSPIIPLSCLSAFILSPIIPSSCLSRFVLFPIMPSLAIPASPTTESSWVESLEAGKYNVLVPHHFVSHQCLDLVFWIFLPSSCFPASCLPSYCPPIIPSCCLAASCFLFYVSHPLIVSHHYLSWSVYLTYHHPFILSPFILPRIVLSPVISSFCPPLSLQLVPVILSLPMFLTMR